MKGKVKDLRELPVEELKFRSEDLSKELFRLRNEKKLTKKVEKPHLFREKRRERARVLTLLKEKRG